MKRKATQKKTEQALTPKVNAELPTAAELASIVATLRDEKGDLPPVVVAFNLWEKCREWLKTYSNRPEEPTEVLAARTYPNYPVSLETMLTILMPNTKMADRYRYFREYVLDRGEDPALVINSGDSFSHAGAWGIAWSFAKWKRDAISKKRSAAAKKAKQSRKKI